MFIYTSRHIQHPNILCFLGTVVTVFILTNYVQGKNLHDVVFDSENPRVCYYISSPVCNMHGVCVYTCVCLPACLSVCLSVHGFYLPSHYTNNEFNHVIWTDKTTVWSSLENHCHNAQTCLLPVVAAISLVSRRLLQ